MIYEFQIETWTELIFLSCDFFLRTHFFSPFVIVSVVIALWDVYFLVSLFVACEWNFNHLFIFLRKLASFVIYNKIELIKLIILIFKKHDEFISKNLHHKLQSLVHKTNYAWTQLTRHRWGYLFKWISDGQKTASVVQNK